MIGADNTGYPQNFDIYSYMGVFRKSNNIL
jgi:hypothetical protein